MKALGGIMVAMEAAMDMEDLLMMVMDMDHQDTQEAFRHTVEVTQEVEVPDVNMNAYLNSMSMRVATALTYQLR